MLISLAVVLQQKLLNFLHINYYSQTLLLWSSVSLICRFTSDMSPYLAPSPNLLSMIWVFLARSSCSFGIIIIIIVLYHIILWTVLDWLSSPVITEGACLCDPKNWSHPFSSIHLNCQLTIWNVIGFKQLAYSPVLFLISCPFSFSIFFCIIIASV